MLVLACSPLFECIDLFQNRIHSGKLATATGAAHGDALPLATGKLVGKANSGTRLRYRPLH